MVRVFVLTVAAILGACLVVGAADPLLTVHFIDVGLGDAILVDYGVFEALIDGGSDETCREYIEEYVDGFLEVVIVTQMDESHIGGLSDVLAAYPVAAIYTNGSVPATEAYAAFAAAAESSYVATVRVGDAIPMGDLVFEVLHPVELTGDEAADSLVLSLSFRGWDFLLAGGIDSTAEEELVAAGLGRTDILKVARYGSADATSAEFLEVTQPIACVVSVSPNPYGYPAAEVFDRIGCAPREAIVFWTHVHGDVILSVEEDGGVIYRTSIPEDPLSFPCTISVPEPPCDCADDTLNCEDFACQQAAQACYEYGLEATGRDVHGLDHDEDGIACEELPEVCP